jgi:hypothetical protein
MRTLPRLIADRLIGVFNVFYNLSGFSCEDFKTILLYDRAKSHYRIEIWEDLPSTDRL